MSFVEGKNLKRSTEILGLVSLCIAGDLKLEHFMRSVKNIQLQNCRIASTPKCDCAFPRLLSPPAPRQLSAIRFGVEMSPAHRLPFCVSNCPPLLPSSQTLYRIPERVRSFQNEAWTIAHLSPLSSCYPHVLRT